MVGFDFPKPGVENVVRVDEEDCLRTIERVRAKLKKQKGETNALH